MTPRASPLFLASASRPAARAIRRLLTQRPAVTERRLVYVVGISKTTQAWPPGKAPEPPPHYSGNGRPPQRSRRTKSNAPTTVLELARSLPPESWQLVRWREGSDGDMSGRFAALRVRPARRDGRYEIELPEEWLLIEWPEGEPEPSKYWFSTLDSGLSTSKLVRQAKLRWRIERDYQELKQEVGFGDYQGRGWRGFHHHITLCIAAYAFLLAERARLSPPVHKAQPPVQVPPLPEGFRHRGSPRPR
jgi:SRSO17 transposase